MCTFGVITCIMRYRLRLVLHFVCLCIFAVLFISQASAPRHGLFVHNTSLDGQICHSETQVIFEAVPSKITCGTNCLVNTSCTAFLYNTVTGLCLVNQEVSHHTIPTNICSPSDEQNMYFYNINLAPTATGSQATTTGPAPTTTTSTFAPTTTQTTTEGPAPFTTTSVQTTTVSQSSIADPAPTTTTNTSTGFDHCAAGYNWYSAGGYCYKYSRACKTWQDARDHCHAEGAHLLMLKTAEERDYFIRVYEFYYDYLGENCPDWQAVFIGATDLEVEGDFKWADGSSANSDLAGFWGPNEPNNNNDQDCVQISVAHGNKYDDGFCSTMTNFFCAMQI